MVKVWILIAMFARYNGSNSDFGGPIVIDNIASSSECERVAANYKTVNSSIFTLEYKCIEVWKVVAFK
jgi:hypothetical protein